MTNDFVTDIVHDFESRDYNRYRFYNEPGTWWDELLKEVSEWLKTGTDVYIKQFVSKHPWFHGGNARSQYHEVVDGQDLVFQWTILNHGHQIEFACKRIQ